MRRIAASAIVALIVATSSAAGELSDAAGTFRFTAPEGWTTEDPPLSSISIVVVSPRRDETGGNCNFIVVPLPATRSMSQAEVEAEFTPQINEQFWRETIGSGDALKLIAIDAWGDKSQRGRKVFYAKVTTEAAPDGVTMRRFKQEQNLHVVPGRIYAVTCTVLAEALPVEAADFDSIFASFEPLLDMTVAAPSTGSPSSVAVRAESAATMRSAAARGFTAGPNRGKAR